MRGIMVFWALALSATTAVAQTDYPLPVRAHGADNFHGWINGWVQLAPTEYVATPDDPSSPRINIFTVPAPTSEDVATAIPFVLEALGQTGADLAPLEYFESFAAHYADLVITIGTGTLNNEPSVIVAEALRLEGETDATVFVLQAPAATYENWGGLLAVLDAFGIVDNGTGTLSPSMQAQIRAAAPAEQVMIYEVMMEVAMSEADTDTRPPANAAYFPPTRPEGATGYEAWTANGWVMQAPGSFAAVAGDPRSPRIDVIEVPLSSLSSLPAGIDEGLARLGLQDTPMSDPNRYELRNEFSGGEAFVAAGITTTDGTERMVLAFSETDTAEDDTATIVVMQADMRDWQAWGGIAHLFEAYDTVDNIAILPQTAKDIMLRGTPAEQVEAFEALQRSLATGNMEDALALGVMIIEMQTLQMMMELNYDLLFGNDLMGID